MAAPAKPSERYEAALQEGRISEDRAQRAALEKLDALAAALQAPAPAPGLFHRLRLRSRPPRAPLQGLYLWGGVGRGKTFLMDLFFEALPLGVGERMHFYRFMRGVHEALKAEAGKANPLEHIAEQWAKRTRVICFDEFFVFFSSFSFTSYFSETDEEKGWPFVVYKKSQGFERRRRGKTRRRRRNS